MTVVSNECGLKRMWTQTNVVSNECGLKWMWSQRTVVSNECGLKWLWSQMIVVSNDDCGLKWLWSQMNVVSNECGLKWMWSQMNRSHMNVISNEQVSNVVVSNERGLKRSGLKWMVSNELVSIVCTPIGSIHFARNYTVVYFCFWTTKSIIFRAAVKSFQHFVHPAWL